jgi:hypothetical protein
MLGREVDIYIPELNLGIEYDGWYWHKDKEEMDREKNKQLKDELFLLRIREAGLEKLTDTDVLLDKTEIAHSSFKDILHAIIETQLIKLDKFKDKIKNYLERECWAADNEFNKIQYERNGLVYERSLSFSYPDISAQWHYERNYPLTPEQFTPSAKRKVWWKDFSGREWEAQIISRVKTIKNRAEQNKNQIDLF